MVLTMGTVAMTTGMRDQGLMLTIRTAELHHRAVLGSTDFHGGQRFELTGQNLALILTQEVCFELLDKECQRDHLISPHLLEKPFINWLIR